MSHRLGRVAIALSIAVGCWSAAARADVIVDNTADSLGGWAGVTSTDYVAQSFYTDNTNYTLTGIKAILFSPGTTTPAAGLYADIGGVPDGAHLLGTLSTTATVGSSASPISFTANSPATLSRNTTYWIVLLQTSNTGNNLNWVLTSSYDKTGPGLIGASAFRNDGGSSWSPNTNFRFEMQVSGTPVVPEPSSIVLMGLGGAIGLAASFAGRSRAGR